jgi:hypothetical protein
VVQVDDLLMEMHTGFESGDLELDGEYCHTFERPGV